jgi:hypothetical protein
MLPASLELRQSRRASEVNFENYLSDLPLLHSWDNGQTWNTGGFEADQLRKLHDFLIVSLPPSPMILETGAGNTTIMLAFLSPTKHVVVCPDEALLKRITHFCRGSGLASDHLEINVGFSEWVLPEIAARTKSGGAPINFGLIDGGHNWPTVFVDFFI